MADIGPFELLGVLGEGGMGVVYRARHRRTGQEAALKTVKLTDARLLQGMRREIQALARLRHPGIVPILDEGVHEGAPWYAMELLRGAPLRASLEKKTNGSRYAAPCEPGGDSPLAGAGGARLGAARGGEAIQALASLCGPLAFLHGEGFVHRDLKPENVLVRPDGSAVLMDFGVTTRFGGREALDMAGGAGGTFGYMAPEQAEGGVVDARADLYALGCILYELVAGRPPFLGETPAQILYQHVQVEPTPPSRFAPDIPPALEALTLRLLEKQPARRLGYATDVQRALAGLGFAPPHASPSPPEPRSYLYRPRFTGHAAQRDALESHLARLMAGGPGSAILLGGESGSGKTRLASELAEGARRQGFWILAGEAQAIAGRPLQLWLKPLQAVADLCREGGVEASERVLGKRGRILSRHEPALAELPGQSLHEPPPELPPKEAQLRLFVALAETLSAFGAGRRLLVVLDDLHWADELSLQFLVFLLKTRALERLPWLIVGTYRTEERGELLRKLTESPMISRLELGRFDEATLGAMAADMLALEATPELFSRFLARHSEGNPFFVAEYLRTAVGEGILFRDEKGYWRVLRRERRHLTEAAYDALPLPGSLRELVGRRLALLDPGALELVQTAAILGREWELGLLAEVAGLPEAGLGAQLSDLFRRQILEEPTPGQPRFAHDKLREIAYAQLDPARRQALHRKAAEAIDRLFPDRAAALGHHWLQAGEPRLALPHLQSAAQLAERRSANQEALLLYQQTLQVIEGLAPQDPSLQEQNLDLLHRCQDVLSFLGQFDEALEMARRMERRARQLGSDLILARALRNQAAVWLTQGNPRQGLPLLDQAIRTLDQLQDRKLLAGALNNRQQAYLFLGRLEESILDGTRALELFEALQDLAQIGDTQQLLAVVLYEQGFLGQSRRHLEQALRSFRESGSMLWAMLCETNLGNLDLFEGRYASAENALRQVVDQARKSDAWLVLVTALNKLGILEAELGRSDSAAAFLDEAIQRAQEIGDMEWGLRSYNALGRVYLRWERWEPAKSMFRDGLRIEQEGAWPGALFGGLALCEAHAGNATGCAENFAKARDRLQDWAPTDVRAAIDLDQAEAHLLAGKPEKSLEPCSRILELAQSQARPDILFRANALRSKAQLRLGQPQEATRSAESAMRALQGIDAFLTDAQRASFWARPDITAWREELGDWLQNR